MTQNQVQGVFGEFKPVLDVAGGSFSDEQVQGVFGEFKPVLTAPTGGPVQTTKTFTLDAIVLVEVTKTFTIDGKITAVSTNTFTIDGIIGGGGYSLGSIFLPTPKSLKRVSLFQKIDVLTIAGDHGRDLGPRKEKYLLQWQNLTVGQVDAIMTQVNLNTAVAFTVDDGNLQISTRNVITRPGSRSYQTPGADYLEHFSIELIVEEA